ncbi:MULTISPECIES: sugar transferase [Eggerthella]|uniref:sugar transferase n=2 Tax=Eggerthella TaxID=84111 RepID=UPI0012EDF18E|nr:MULTISPECIES: sugar transferase [Eggerthella]MDU2446264.1 sugar transferase [Eggerthella sp.]MCQ5239179.1 sugar transferase [Eggerthella lenta]MDB1767282.1 sugar transferase [Eggerthella lenta]MDB1773459.1 sugar transferase [Eggerthella lenta]MDB1776534.1 sugar transferase [Eggerthella lenta]
MSENELENGITAVDAGGAVALDDGCCPERGAAAPGHPKKATGGVRQAVILSEATVGSEVEGSRAAPAESVREYEPLAVEGRLGYHFVKRAFDIVFSACATIVGLIPVALLCLVIRLESPGSPIYLQERVGYRGKPLRILKLRTMVADSDDVEKHLSPEQLTQWERERKVDDDPRVTRVGRFLRKTSLDELPQFLNVLAGQMSVIGPRPVVEEELAAYGDDAGELLSAKPGITGWWQVQARNDATYGDGSRQELELSRGGLSGAPRRFAQPLRGEGLPAPRLARAPAPRDAWQLPQRPEPPSPQSPPPPCGFTAQSLRSSKFYLRRREAGVYLPATSS